MEKNNNLVKEEQTLCGGRTARPTVTALGVGGTYLGPEGSMRSRWGGGLVTSGLKWEEEKSLLLREKAYLRKDEVIRQNIQTSHTGNTSSFIKEPSRQDAFSAKKRAPRSDTPTTGATEGSVEIHL